jgi:hypothetical protein
MRRIRVLVGLMTTIMTIGVTSGADACCRSKCHARRVAGPACPPNDQAGVPYGGRNLEPAHVCNTRRAEWRFYYFKPGIAAGWSLRYPSELECEANRLIYQSTGYFTYPCQQIIYR